MIPQEPGYQFISLGYLPEWDSYGSEGQVRDCIDSDGQKMYRKMWLVMREDDVALLRSKGCTLLDGWYHASASDSTAPSSERATHSTRVYLPGVFKKPGEESGTENNSFQHVYLRRVLEYEADVCEMIEAYFGEQSHARVSDMSGGCGTSYIVDVVSPKFEGQSRLERQRMVQEAIETEAIKNRWRTVQIRTGLPE